ncbi:FAD-dependent monooxygenase [Rhodococcus sp. H29-C3]|uniref:FAD-dependent monooxygenase n=1 Tax=Rhodococcus sp. H29-C3 TaxID=3046307 RepID=UPI0024B9E969|nr:FAD-dependent monooxygenase [Rhodococcus sp. H29-C3]MDJ0362472.1 FAD-dependent monooxygenase [Rhodococcus sp. H29-C3]
MDADVVIVGAGPTGLLTAYEVALGGASVIIIDKLPARTGQSRALNLHPRTAEVLELRGILDAAQKQARAKIGTTHFAHMPVDVALDGWSSRYPYQVGIPQAEVENLLEKHLENNGVTIRWATEVVDIVQDPDSISITTNQGVLTSKYLVAADGGRSTIRKLLDVDFPGLDARWFGTVADVTLSGLGNSINPQWDSKGTPVMRQDTSFANIFPIGVDGDMTFRIFYSVHGQKIGDPRAPVPAEEVVQVIHDFYGTDVEIEDVIWGSRFSDASRLVDRYKIGRVFLAGDAAHIHLPLGGQGLNTGLQDAFNLGWKLASVLMGRASDTLLDTYHTERHPVGAAVMRNTRAQVALGQKGSEHEALRDLFADLMRIPQVNRYLGGAISGLSVGYHDDPDSASGTRLVDFKLDDEHWASSLFVTGHFVLLTHANDLRISTPYHTVVRVVGEEGELSSDAVLVRPDGYIAWTSADGDLDKALLRLGLHVPQAVTAS